MRYLILVAMLAPALAQEPGWRKVDEGSKLEQGNLSDAQVQEIITKFAAKEAEFARARARYTYRQTARLVELEQDGVPLGRWEEVSDILFDGEGKRVERVVKAPVETLRKIQRTPEDLEDLRNTQPFVLTTKELPKYDISYLGKQMADEIPTYVFAVKPKKLEKGLRYFQGQIWVDDKDLQIVKSYGRAVGIVGKNNLFPKFETYREQIDGKYWFPTYTRADDVLPFEAGPQRIRLTVKYEDYKLFTGDVNIQFGDVVDNPKPETPEPKPAQPPKP